MSLLVQWRLMLLSLLLLAACQHPPAPASDKYSPQTSFGVDARFSLKYEDANKQQKTQQGSLTWVYTVEREQLDLYGPLGITLLRGARQGSRVEVQLLSGDKLTGDSWAEVLAQVLPYPLPIADAAIWLRAQEDELRWQDWQIRTLKRDPQGRPSLQEWQKQVSPAISLRLVIEAWH